MIGNIFVIIPCYNEAQNIGLLMDEWNSQTDQLVKQGYSLNIVGIDDCSTDDTGQIIHNYANSSDSVSLISHKENEGLCGGLNSAIAYFVSHGSENDYMVVMDGDNTQSPSYVHEMLSLIKRGKDCVIASRYCESSSVHGLAPYREFLSDMAKHYYSFVLNVPNVKDYTCGYRIYSFAAIKKLVERFGAKPIKEQSFACMMEMLYKLYLVGASFGEVGFELRYDKKKGESKMRVLKTMHKSLTTALTLKIAGKKESNAYDD